MAREEFLERARAAHGDKYEYIDVPDEFVAKKTEHQIMLERGIFRIYDCGCRAHLWKMDEK